MPPRSAVSTVPASRIEEHRGRRSDEGQGQVHRAVVHQRRSEAGEARHRSVHDILSQGLKHTGG